MTPAQGKKQRADLMKQIARDLKKADRARVLELRAKVRELRAERSRAIARARAACKRRRGGVPTVKEALAMLRAARAEARATCDRELASAAQLKTAEQRARAEREAERRHQAAMRRIERQGKERTRERRPTLARTRLAESDDEVRGNIPPELVALFERVKRSIKGSPRMTRTEEFLQYAHDHPDEEIEALEAKADEMIREYERRANAGERGGRRNPKKGKRQTGAQRDLFMPATGQLEIVPSYEQREIVKQQRESAEKRTIPLFGNPRRKPTKAELRKRAAQRRRGKMRPPTAEERARFAQANPRHPPAAWWDRCLEGVKRAGGRRVREPRAVCGAAWWNLPPARRAAIVRKLEGARDPRARGAAVALARAEKKHHARRGGPVPVLRRSNPRELVSLVYLEKKPGDGRPYEYEHDFSGDRPALEMRGGKAQIVGGTYTTRNGWLEG